MADQFYGLTDTGRERSSNEDTFVAQRSINNRFIIACAIDGVGGYAGGEVAAALTREAVLQRLERPAGEVIPILLDCFNLANQKILSAKKEVKEHQHMACVATLALVDLERNQFHFAHVGDTRLYLLRDGSLVKITHDQSFVGFLEDSGRLNEDDAMAHPKRNEINKALGFNRSVSEDNDYIETGSSPFLPGDMLLLCSDGLTDMVGKTEMTEIITRKISIKEKCQELIAAANARGGRDNITVVLVENDKQAVQHNATKPVAVSQKKAEPEIEVAPQPAKVAETMPVEETRKKKSGGKWLTTFIAFVLLLFAAGAYWVVTQRENQQPTVVKPAPQPVQPAPIQPEVKLQNMIDSLKGNLIVLTDSVFKGPIILTKPIQINKDTLFVKTKGSIVLQADTAYKGAAINISPQTRLVMLDSITLKNFQTGIAGDAKPLLLKNMRFINCPFPVQNGVKLENNKYISGTAAKFKADTVPVNTRRK